MSRSHSPIIMYTGASILKHRVETDDHTLLLRIALKKSIVRKQRQAQWWKEGTRIVRTVNQNAFTEQKRLKKKKGVWKQNSNIVLISFGKEIFLNNSDGGKLEMTWLSSWIIYLLLYAILKSCRSSYTRLWFICSYLIAQ